MNRIPLAIAVLSAALGVAGCASTETQKTASSGAAPVAAPNTATKLSTGSRLPPHATTQPLRRVDKEDWSRSQSVIGNLPDRGF